MRLRQCTRTRAPQKNPGSEKMALPLISKLGLLCPQELWPVAGKKAARCREHTRDIVPCGHI